MDAQTLFTCKAVVSSEFIKGEADIILTEDDFALTSLFDAVRVSWADIFRLDFADYNVTVHAGAGVFVFSKIGYDAEPLYVHMLAAYNAKVRKCFFVSGDPVVAAKGDAQISFSGRGLTAPGAEMKTAVFGVPAEVYEDCVIVLPPDISARRVPLRFANGFSDADFQVRVSASDGSSCALSKLGYDHAPFSKAVQAAIKNLRDETLRSFSEIDSSLSAAQSTKLLELMPGGSAAPLGALRAVAPSFVDALEAELAQGHAAETYPLFKEITDAEKICVGFKNTGQEASPFELWIIAPSPDGKACAVEFACAQDDAAATYIYSFGGSAPECSDGLSWEEFRVRFNIALEAVDFKRDVIRLTDDELACPENIDIRMAVERNASLRFVRGCFTGRAIHRGAESWQKQLLELWGRFSA